METCGTGEDCKKVSTPRYWKTDNKWKDLPWDLMDSP